MAAKRSRRDFNSQTGLERMRAKMLYTLTHLGLKQLGNLNNIPNLTADNFLLIYSPEGKVLFLEKPSEGSPPPNFSY